MCYGTSASQTTSPRHKQNTRYNRYVIENTTRIQHRPPPLAPHSKSILREKRPRTLKKTGPR